MTTNQPLSLFISSKMQELAQERRAIQASLSDYHMYGWLWEVDAGARPAPIRSTYLKEVKACDIYIGLFWLGYGQYTIEEYEHARELDKPCLVYDKHVDIERRDQALRQFLEKLGAVGSSKSLTICWFETVEELAGFVQRDVLRLLTSVFRESRQQPLPAQPTGQSYSSIAPQGIARVLSFEEQADLTELLLKCSAISDQSQRESVLSLLPADLTQRIIRGNTNMTDVLQIVKKANEYGDGITKLVRATCFVGGNTLPLQEVVTYLQRISAL